MSEMKSYPPTIKSIFKVMSVPGSYQIVCPVDSCRHVREPVEEETNTILRGEGFNYMVTCKFCYSTFSLHEGLLQRKFLFYEGFPYSKSQREDTIIPWNPFGKVTMTLSFRFKIGITERLDAHDFNEDLLEVLDIVPYEKGTTKNIIIEPRKIEPTIFNIVSSSDDPSDVGLSAECTLFIFGLSKVERDPVWKELLGGAISLINKKAFNSSIIQSGAALDAFMAHFLKENIIGKDIAGKVWSNKKIYLQYFDPQIWDFVPKAKIYCQIFQELLKIDLDTIDCYKCFFGSEDVGLGIKDLRNKLAHGDFEKYNEILKEKNLTEEGAAHWSIQNIIKMIYHLLFFKPKPLPQKEA